jgi:hypothetical protein
LIPRSSRELPRGPDDSRLHRRVAASAEAALEAVASIRADFVLRLSREFYSASLRWPANVALEIGAPSGTASR